MEKQTIYLLTPVFTSQAPLSPGQRLPLLEKVSGRPCVLPACSAITEVCVQRASSDTLTGAGSPATVQLGTFGNAGASQAEFNLTDINDADVCHLCNCCTVDDVKKSSTEVLPLEIDMTGASTPTLTQGQLVVVIKYVQMPLGPKATKSSAQEPVKFKVYNVPFNNPTGNGA